MLKDSDAAPGIRQPALRWGTASGRALPAAVGASGTPPSATSDNAGRPGEGKEEQKTGRRAAYGIGCNRGKDHCVRFRL